MICIISLIDVFVIQTNAIYFVCVVYVAVTFGMNDTY